jgi:hypothetical protein
MPAYALIAIVRLAEFSGERRFLLEIRLFPLCPLYPRTGVTLGSCDTRIIARYAMLVCRLIARLMPPLSTEPHGILARSLRCLA